MVARVRDRPLSRTASTSMLSACEDSVSISPMVGSADRGISGVGESVERPGSHKAAEGPLARDLTNLARFAQLLYRVRMKWISRLILASLLVIATTGATDAAQDNLNPVPPFQIFDNLYYVGLEAVSAYILETSDGLILIDSLYPDQADHIMAATREVGLNPDDIKYVIVTHAHIDHAGSAGAIQSRTDAQVGMAEADWVIYERGGYISSRGAERVFAPLERDLVINDGDTVTLGDTTVNLYVTPGHTPGVTSLEFSVRDEGTPYKAFMLGGLGLNTVNGVVATEQYIASVGRVLAMPGLLVNLTNHPGGAGIFERHDQLRTRGEGDPHPFVDPEGLRTYLQSLLRNAERKLEEESAAGGL
jgi:metallo-beta-lactamase class B